MTLNCKLCQSEFSVLSGRIIIILSKICFLCTYTDQMIIQQRLMFCSPFSFTIFLLMFFPLFSKVFTTILKIYKLPKIDNTIPIPVVCHRIIIDKLCLFVTVLCWRSINILLMTCSIGDTNYFQYYSIRFYITCGLILIFFRKYLSPAVLLSVRKNIWLWEGDLYQNVLWSIGCLISYGIFWVLSENLLFLMPSIC